LAIPYHAPAADPAVYLAIVVEGIYACQKDARGSGTDEAEIAYVILAFKNETNIAARYSACVVQNRTIESNSIDATCN
jgi:hypothetical protein